MTTAEQAVEKAFEYIASFSGRLNIADEPRLESIQHLGSEWVVTVSYFTQRKPGDSIALNALAQALSYQRSFKEIDIDEATVNVTAMRNPRPQVAALTAG